MKSDISLQVLAQECARDAAHYHRKFNLFAIIGCLQAIFISVMTVRMNDPVLSIFALICGGIGVTSCFQAKRFWRTFMDLRQECLNDAKYFEELP